MPTNDTREQAITELEQALDAYHAARYGVKPDPLGGWQVFRADITVARCMSHMHARDYAGYLNDRQALEVAA